MALKFPLSKNEIKLVKIHKFPYQEQYNRLNLSVLNLLRCELQYKYKEKIKPIALQLTQNTHSTLTIATLLTLLNKNELYSKLDHFYKNELQSVIFYKNPAEKTQNNTSSYRNAFNELIVQEDTTLLELIYEMFDLTSIFKLNLLQSMNNISNDLYNELYKKIILDQVS